MPLSPTGGAQSNISRHLTSVSFGIVRAIDRNGSAHVLAKSPMRLTRSSLEEGKGMGSGWPKKPGRIGQEKTAWQVYLFESRLFSGAFPGASMTGNLMGCQWRVVFETRVEWKAYR